MSTMIERLVRADFLQTATTAGRWERVDDVYVTEAVRDLDTLLWKITVTNTEAEAFSESYFRVTPGGSYVDGDIDEDTARALYGALFA